MQNAEILDTVLEWETGRSGRAGGSLAAGRSGPGFQVDKREAGKVLMMVPGCYFGRVDPVTGRQGPSLNPLPQHLLPGRVN